RRVEQGGVAVGERSPSEHGEDDGDEVAERREDEEARVTLGGLEVAGGAEPDEEADIHSGVVPEEGSLTARVFRGEALREHHVDAGDVEAAAGEEEGEADVEQRERAGGDTRAAEDLQRHASDKQVAVRKEAAAQVTAEEVQAVVECAEHAHQRGGRLHAELQMLRRVEDQRREDLNEEQRSRSLRSRGEKALGRVHPAFLCRSARRLMSSHACDRAGLLRVFQKSRLWWECPGASASPGSRRCRLIATASRLRCQQRPVWWRKWGAMSRVPGHELGYLR